MYYGKTFIPPLTLCENMESFSSLPCIYCQDRTTIQMTNT